MMKKLVSTLFVAVVSTSMFSQEEKVLKGTDSLYRAKVETLDSTLNSLYGVISGDKGEERDWELFKYILHPDAKLIPSGKDNDGNLAVKYLTPQHYIDFSGKWLLEKGFYEKEINRIVDSFGNIAQVFSTYESYHSKADTKPFMRGINSIQLLYDGKRWWVINIFWMQETPENPIPQKYLPEQH